MFEDQLQVANMKFKTPLTEAVLLKRNFRFLAEVVLSNKRRRTLYCPNLSPLLNCDVLGTRVWFSLANRLSQGYLDTFQLAEVNGGALVAIHPEHAQTIVREGLHQGLIPELKDFRFLHVNVGANSNTIELLLKENGEQCFIHVEPVFFGDDRGEAYFPETLNQSIQPIQELIVQKELGNPAVLFYCIQHTGVRCLRLAEMVHPLYAKTLRLAIQAGVEILAYRAFINLQEMKLDARIPILLSEDITSG